MTDFMTIDDLGDISGKRVLVRADLNVPFKAGVVSDFTRLEAVKPTLNDLCAKGATCLVLSHFGRPKGQRVSEMSLAPVADALGKVLSKPVVFIDDCKGSAAQSAAQALNPGSVAVLENTRFYAEEEANDPNFASAIAQLGDIYVNDAFSAAHRAHASTEGITKHLSAYAGRSMERELKALSAALEEPKRPVAAVVGGAKVSSKLDVLTNLVEKVDHLIIGGGMANTFLAAKGVDVGKSLCEHDLTGTALQILGKAEASSCTVHLPYDVVVAQAFEESAPSQVVNVHEVGADDMILDVGPAAVEACADALKVCRTLVWNGPMGAFEITPFDRGTVQLAQAAAALAAGESLLTVAGGGDTVAALNHAGVASQFNHISTAGGAFLEWMEGKTLPGVAALQAA
ncbi:MAG: phosphoglycerate kinase [Pseudomonadota bacterium]